MSTKHTPRPWFVKFVGGAFLVRAEKRHAKDWRVVAQVVLHEREDEANARLIAAAPDLLECLKELLDAMYESDGAYGIVRTGVKNAGDAEIIQRCDAAIAKAEGHD